MRDQIEDYWREAHLARRLRHRLHAAHRARSSSGRPAVTSSYYRENMYSPMEIEDAEYQSKPMNCPFHITMYKTAACVSYRELPLRLAELGTVYRYERSGVLHGLLRVRGFTQDDAHLFCRRTRSTTRSTRVLDFSLEILSTFGFTEFEIYLSTRPDEVRRRPTRTGRRPRTRCDDALAEARAAVQGGRGRGRVLRPEDRHQDQGLRWGARGSARRSSSTSTCPSASTSSTSARTAASTGRA